MSDGIDSDRGGPLTAAGVFGALAVAWIVGTDFLVDRFVPERVEGTAQTIKGLVFVVGVALLGYLALRSRQRLLDRIRADLMQISRRADLLALFLQHADAAVIATDMEGEIIVWNRGAERIFGWSEDEAVGMVVGEVTVPPENAGPAAEIMDVMRRTGRWSGEFEVRRKDGSAFSAWVSNRLVRAPGGRPLGIVGVSVDVTPYKEQQESLRVAERRLMEILDGLPVPFLTVDAGLDVTFMNAAAREALRSGGSSDRADAGGPVGAELLAIVRAALAGDHPDGTMVSLDHPDGRSMYVASTAVVESIVRPGHRFVLLALVDVTQPIEMRVRLEERERTLDAQAKALRRSNEALQQFAHAASHELIEPLRTIGLATQRLRRNVGALSEEDLAAGLDTIAERSRRSKETIDALLEFSTVQPAAPTEPVAARAVIADIVNDLGSLLERTGAEVAWEVDDAMLWVDRNVLGMIVGNLVSNAVKFVADGVRPVVGVRGRVEGGEWVLSVTDNGVGIGPDERERVFGLLTRGGNLDREGVGMGLALVRWVVEALGGTIALDDARGGGTVATLRIPIRPS